MNGSYFSGVVLDKGFSGDRIVVTIPGDSYKKWTYFGVVAEEKWVSRLIYVL